MSSPGTNTKFPQLKKHLPSIALRVNQQYASPDTKLKADDEIALLPPVSGGAESPAIARRYASITRDSINTQQVVDALKRGEDGAALALKESSATRRADARRFTSITKPTNRWRCSRWNRWPARRYRNFRFAM